MKARDADQYRMDGIAIRGRSARRDAEGSSRALEVGGDATALLARAREGDVLLVAGLVPAPSLRVALTPEATMVLRDSLLRIVATVAATPDAAVPWIHDAVLAVLRGASADDRRDASDSVRSRWHQAWRAPVTVVTATAAVDAATPASVAVLLAGAELGVAKGACAHA